VRGKVNRGKKERKYESGMTFSTQEDRLEERLPLSQGEKNHRTK